MQTPTPRPLILIVDDTPTNIQVLAEALRAEYRVKVATSGKAALAIAGNLETRPDLILLDVMMPEMDGYEVCRRLKQGGATQGIPVIFVTAKTDVTDEEHGLSLGAVDYIVKPFHLAIVRARVRNHISLKMKTDLLELILASAGEGIYGVDREGNCTFINPAAVRIAGWTTEDFIGRNPHPLIHHTRADGSPYPNEECPILHPLCSDAIREVRDEVFWRKDGTSFPVEYIATPIRRDGNIGGAVVVFRDVSAQKAAENTLARQRSELERSNLELERFAYVTSHDLREPLRMISSYLGLIERRYNALFDDDGREFLAFATDGARRMDRLIHDLLEYSRIGCGGDSLAPVNLGVATSEALANMSVGLQETDARIEAEASLPRVLGNHGELVRLMQNLIGNAIKYHAQNRKPRVSITSRPMGTMWEVKVADNGIGIAPQDQDRIFGVFQRLHGREIEGSGIGLASCKKIVEKHGGRIWVESDGIDHGTTLIFTLPMAPPPLPEP